MKAHRTAALPGHPLTEPNRPDLRELAEDFHEESRAFSVLYGRSFPEQLEWARGALPADAVQDHMHSWSRGRQVSQRYLDWLASYLRRHAGEHSCAPSHGHEGPSDAAR